MSEKAERLNEWVTLYEGRCEDVLPQLELSVDLVLTDPPYSVSVPGMVHRREAGKGVRRMDFFEGDSDWAAMTKSVEHVATLAIGLLADHGSMYWWVGHRQFGRLIDLFERSGFSTRFLVWSKACPVPPPPGSGWPSGAELCVYAYKPGRTWNLTPKTTPGSNVIVADSYRHGQPGKLDHPTQKPLPIVKPLIVASTNPGDTILDCYAGTGTTADAAMRLGRRCILIERDPHYCDVIRRRVARAGGQDAESLFAGAAGREPGEEGA